MTHPQPTVIRSRDNVFFKEVRKLAHDSAAYRKAARVWLEGEHLCTAALARGLQPLCGVFSESYWPTAPTAWAHAAQRSVVVSDALFRDLSALESHGRWGFMVDLPRPGAIAPHAGSVVLDRVQDAGNVGSILRSASAFGFRQVLALQGTAALWSPKVLRAGMGAHFGLELHEGLAAGDLEALTVPWLVTDVHQGALLQDVAIPQPCAWVLGHEGQGVAPALAARARVRVRIGQPGGEESLNVAAAAAICLHASTLYKPAR
jgi:TrmH family RNA methyltransferase